jgi:hypothetical protein
MARKETLDASSASVRTNQTTRVNNVNPTITISSNGTTYQNGQNNLTNVRPRQPSIGETVWSRLTATYMYITFQMPRLPTIQPDLRNGHTKYTHTNLNKHIVYTFQCNIYSRCGLAKMECVNAKYATKSCSCSSNTD